MHSTKIIGGVAALALGLAAAAFAGGHTPIEQRQAAMKANGGFAKALGGYAKGQTAYDAGKVLAALQGMKAATEGFTDYFPEGSDSGDTKAGPLIWSDRAGFLAAYGQFRTALDAGIAAQPANQAQLQAAFGQIGKACGNCHERYRLK